MNDLEAIVRELAKSPLIAATEIHGDPYCVLCGEEAITRAERDALSDGDLGAHGDDCLWVRARRAVEAMG